MKKAAVVMLFLLCFALLLPLTAAAEEPEEARVRDAFDAFLARIPPEVAELLPADFFGNDFAAAGEAVREASGARAILSVAARITGLAVRDHLALLARTVGVLVLLAVFRAVAGENGALSRAVSLCGVLALSLALFLPQREQLLRLAAYFTLMKDLFAALLPLMGTLYAMGGNVGAAVANQTVLSAFLSVMGVLSAGTVTTVAGVCLAFALLEGAGCGICLRPLAGCIKRTFAWGLSLAMTLLCGVLGIQTTLAKSADTLALRTAGFAASSFLPVVGGSVAQTLRTVAGSVEYLRAVVGMGGVLVVLFAFLPVFLSVLCTRLAVLLGGAAASLFGLDNEARFLAEIASVWGYFLAVIAVLFVTATFALTVFARCAAVGG